MDVCRAGGGDGSEVELSGAEGVYEWERWEEREEGGREEAGGEGEEDMAEGKASGVGERAVVRKEASQMGVEVEFVLRRHCEAVVDVEVAVQG